jgi:hypothetical protein
MVKKTKTQKAELTSLKSKDFRTTKIKNKNKNKNINNINVIVNSNNKKTVGKKANIPKSVTQPIMPIMMYSQPVQNDVGIGYHKLLEGFSTRISTLIDEN